MHSSEKTNGSFFVFANRFKGQNIEIIMGLIQFFCRFQWLSGWCSRNGTGNFCHFNPVSRNSVTIGFLIM